MKPMFWIARAAALAMVIAGAAQAGTVTASQSLHGSYKTGQTLWFSSTFSPLIFTPTTYTELYLTGGTLTLFDTRGREVYSVDVPDAEIIYDPSTRTVSQSTTTFLDAKESDTPHWVTTVPTGDTQSIFATGLELPINTALAATNIASATWTQTIGSNQVIGPIGSWQWGAALYSNLPTDYDKLGVKPSDDYQTQENLNGTIYNFAHGADEAGSLSKPWTNNLVSGGSGYGGTDYTGNLTSPSYTYAGYQDKPFHPGAPTPEPSSFVLIGGGLVAVACIAARRRRLAKQAA